MDGDKNEDDCPPPLARRDGCESDSDDDEEDVEVIEIVQPAQKHSSNKQKKRKKAPATKPKHRLKGTKTNKKKTISVARPRQER